MPAAFYTDYTFTDVFWPDFNNTKEKALDFFANRERRFAAPVNNCEHNKMLKYRIITALVLIPIFVALVIVLSRNGFVFYSSDRSWGAWNVSIF